MKKNVQIVIQSNMMSAFDHLLARGLTLCMLLKSWRPKLPPCLRIGDLLSWTRSGVLLGWAPAALFLTVPPNLPLKGETSLRNCPLSCCLGVLRLEGWRWPLDNSIFLELLLELIMLREGRAGGANSWARMSASSWKSYRSSY